jgi:NAD(P)H dehydrogenase (quinone)
MKHAVILSHPNVQSFTSSVAEAYGKTCQAMGHEVVIRDLYRMNFDPCLKSTELPFTSPVQPGPDVVAERSLLKDCDVFALFYPLWLNAPPAMIKGYLERVFGFGFAYGAGGHSYNPLLSERKLITFSSSGAPLTWLIQTGALASICALFDDYFANLCGMTALEHVHVGGVTPDASVPFIDARLEDVRKTVARHFGSETCR